MMRSQWRAPIALIVLAVLFACLKGRTPTDASANGVRFDLKAQVTGGSTLHVTVVYLDQSPTSEVPTPVMLLDRRITVASGTQDLPLTIDVTRCLADPQHIQGPTCELLAGVVLEQNGQPVDSVGIGPISVSPGQTVHDSTSLTAVSKVVVFPKTASLTVGAITVLKDSVYGPTGYLPNATVTWRSADSTIAKVNQNGAVTGVAIGITSITASAGGQSDSATITVNSISAPDTVVINVPGGLPGISFSASAGSAIPSNAPLEITAKNTADVISNLASHITYTSGSQNGWLVANVSDSVSYFFGQRVVSRQIRRQTSGSGIVTPGVVDIVPNTTNLPAGTYTATVTVTGTNANSASITVTYTISVAAPTLAFTPNPVVFDQYAYGSALAPLQTVTAYNSGSGTLGPLSTIGTITYTGADANWLTIAAASGTTATGQPKTTSLHLGSDTASIPISATGASNNPVTLTAIVNSWVTYQKVVLGSVFGCGLTTASTVYCWGGSGLGELGDGGSDLGLRTPVRALIPYSPTNPVIDIEAGSNHACALLQSGTVYCWGDNSNGQVGVGSAAATVPTPTAIPGKTYGQISLGAYHTCAIEGTPPLAGANYVDCWGDNTNGQFGNNLPTSTPQTSPVVTGNIFAVVSAGNGYTCAITNTSVSGNVRCAGRDDFGQLGNGYATSAYSSFVQSNVLTVTGGPATVKSISAGNTTTCAVDNAGTGYCWGDNTLGEVGDGNTTTPVVNPTILTGYSWTSISTGSNSVCGIASTGDFCWGYNNDGQLGNGAVVNASTSTPTAVIGSGAFFTEFTVGVASQSACYITSSAVECFGLDGNGQLGDGGIVTALTGTPTLMTAQPAPSGVGPSRVVPRRPVVTNSKTIRRPAVTRSH